METKKVTILGEGAWGTAVALLLADNGYEVILWCHHEHIAQEIKHKHTNGRYLPGFVLPTSIIPTHDIQEVLTNIDYVFEAIPIKYLRSVLMKAKPFVHEKQIWIALSKGIEQDTLLLPTQMFDAIFDFSVQKAVIAGPSFAREVAEKRITAVTIASDNRDLIMNLQHMFVNSYLRPYGSDDVIGVQCSAALKNVITLCIGMLNGSGYGDNTKSFFLTRGLYEINVLIKAMGGKQETVYGLSGIGDLALTAMGRLSRNLEVGKQLGMGEALDAIVTRTGYTPEGVNTVVAVQQLSERLGCDLPLCRGIYEVIYKNKSITYIINTLMHQPLEWEIY